MTGLAELQAAVKRYLLNGDNEEQLCTKIIHGGAPAAARIDVYRNAYYVRLQEALAHDFPALLAAAGEKEFGRLMAEYLRERRSTRASLSWLGEPLADWLRANGEPRLGDLASLEWAVLRAFDSEDAAVLCASELKAIPPERWPELRLSLPPSVKLLHVGVNARAIWSAVRRGETLPDWLSQPERLVVWRTANGPAVEPLAPGTDVLLDVLSSGAKLASACERLADAMDPAAVPGFVAEQLHYAAERGWFDALPEGRSDA